MLINSSIEVNRMEFLFMKEWDYGNSIVIRSKLLQDIVKSKYFAKLNKITETIPKNREDAGEEIDRFALGTVRYQLASDITALLTNELKSIVQIHKSNDNPQLLVNLLREIISKENSHFRFG